MTSHRLPFIEGSKEGWDLERERLLAQKISDLGLKIEGTYLQPIVERLYDQLEAAGISLRPLVYLSDEWACPDRIPLIGIPFYLADPQLSRLEDEMMDGIEASTEEEILGYLRHEAGHAFNYAHKLYETPEWLEVFGSFDLPYNDEYSPQPFSRSFVRHIPGWYAQKHPDEDFSETFAVWLNPDSNWREVYRGWGCYPKLEYVGRIVEAYGRRAPAVTGDDYDLSADELKYSVADYYERMRPTLAEVPAQLDGELSRVFHHASASRDGWMRADELLEKHKRRIIFDVAYWTGLYDVKVRSLLGHLTARCKVLDLGLARERESQALIDFTAFMTTLCMNKLYKGDFVTQ